MQRSSLLLMMLIVALSIAQIAKTEQIKIHKSWNGYLGKKDIYVINKADMVPEGFEPNRPQITSNHALAHINRFVTSETQAIDSVSKGCVRAQQLSNMTYIGVCDEQKSMSIMKMLDDGSMKETFRYSNTSEVEAFTSFHIVNETSALLIGFPDHQDRDQLAVIGVGELGGNVSSVQVLNLGKGKMIDFAWTGVDGFKHSLGDGNTEEVVVVYQQVKSVGENGCTYFHILSGMAPEVTLSSVNFLRLADDTEAILNLNIYQHGDQNRGFVTYTQDEMISFTDCLFARGDDGHYTMTDCQAVILSDYQRPETNGMAALIPGENAGDLVFVVFDFESGHFKMCDYNPEGNTVGKCYSSNRSIKNDDDYSLTDTRPSIKYQQGQLKISMRDRETQRSIMILHNIRREGETVNFELVKDLGSYSLVLMEGHLLALKGTTSTFSSRTNSTDFCLEIFSSNQNRSLIEAQVVYTDSYDNGTNLNITYDLNFRVYHPLRSYNVSDNVVNPMDIEMLSNDTQIINLDRSNFHGNLLKFEATSDLAQFNVYNLNDVKADIQGLEQFNLTNPVYSKIHFPHPSNIVAEVMDDNLQSYLATGVCQNQNRGLVSSCNITEIHKVNKIIGITTSEIKSIEATVFFDLDHSRSNLTMFAVPNQDQSDIMAFRVETGLGSNIQSVYVGIHPKDFTKGSGLMSYLLWGSLHNQTWMLNLCWSADFECEAGSNSMMAFTAEDVGISEEVFCPTEIHRVEESNNQFDLLLNCGDGDVQIQRIEFTHLTKVKLIDNIPVNHPILRSLDNQNIQICPTGDEFLIFNQDQGTFYGKSFSESSGIHNFRLKYFELETIKHMICLPEQRLAILVGTFFNGDKAKALLIQGDHAQDVRTLILGEMEMEDPKSLMSAFSSSGLDDNTLLLSFTDTTGTLQLKKAWIDGPIIEVVAPEQLQDGANSTSSSFSINVSNPKYTYSYSQNNLTVAPWNETFSFETLNKTEMTNGIIDLDDLVVYSGPIYQANMSFFNGTEPQDISMSPRMTRTLIQQIHNNQTELGNYKIGVNATSILGLHYAKEGHFVEIQMDVTEDSAVVQINLFNYTNTTAQIQASTVIESTCSETRALYLDDLNQLITILRCRNGRSGILHYVVYDFATSSFQQVRVIADYNSVDLFDCVYFSQGKIAILNLDKFTSELSVVLLDTQTATVSPLAMIGQVGTFASGRLSNSSIFVVGSSIQVDDQANSTIWRIDQEGATTTTVLPTSVLGSSSRKTLITCNTDSSFNSTCAVYNQGRTIQVLQLYQGSEASQIEFSLQNQLEIYERYHPTEITLTSNLVMTRSTRQEPANTTASTIYSFYSLARNNTFMSWGLSQSDITHSGVSLSSFLYTSADLSSPTVIFKHLPQSPIQSLPLLTKFSYNDLSLEIMKNLTTNQQDSLYFNLVYPVGKNQSMNLMKFFDPDFKPHQPNVMFIWYSIIIGLATLFVGWILYLVLNCCRENSDQRGLENITDNYEAFVSKDLMTAKGTLKDDLN